MTGLRFWVGGIPVPQGSMSAFVRGRHASIVDQKAKTLHPWREWIGQVGKQAAAQQGIEPYDEPLQVAMTFYLPRPAKHYGTGRNRYILRGDAPMFPTYKQDVDKLARGVLDAITQGGLIKDDGQVVEMIAIKLYTVHTQDRPGGNPGVQINIRSWKEARGL